MRILVTYSIQQSLIWTQLHGFKYCYLMLIILFYIIHLHTVKWFQILLCNTNNSIQQSFVCTQLNLFKYRKLNICIRLITDTTTPVQNGLGSNGNQEILHISQSYRMGASASDGLVSCPGHLLMGLYLSAEMQSSDSPAPAEWAKIIMILGTNILLKSSCI